MRFSLSHLNTEEEIRLTTGALKDIIQVIDISRKKRSGGSNEEDHTGQMREIMLKGLNRHMFEQAYAHQAVVVRARQTTVRRFQEGYSSGRQDDFDFESAIKACESIRHRLRKHSMENRIGFRGNQKALCGDGK